MEKLKNDDLNRFLEADKINSNKEIENELKKKKKTAWIIIGKETK